MEMKKSARVVLFAITAALIVIVASPMARAEGFSYPGGAPVPDRWEDAEYQVLIKNVNIFDGKTNKLIKGMDVVIIGDHIAKISKSPIKVKSQDL